MRHFVNAVRRLHLKRGKRLIVAMSALFLHMRRTLIAALGFLCVLSSPGLSQSPAPDRGNTHRLAFLSDPQTPMFIEKLFVGSDRNEEATDSLFSSILRTRPASLFILGDLVSLGAYHGAWESMENHIRSVRAAGVPVHALLGNHELMIYSWTGERYFGELFPDHRKTGYCVTIDSVATVMLNSNFGKLDAEEREMQERWYQHALDSLGNCPGVAAIVVCCHHSPFTNSTIVEPDAEVQAKFVPPFIGSPKSRLFLSGHAHTFEHFKECGKDFLVIGGGGGARHALLPVHRRLWADRSPEKKPLFHYITVDRVGPTLTITVWQLSNDFRGVEAGYTITIGM
jgi:hypothetical protein